MFQDLKVDGQMEMNASIPVPAEASAPVRRHSRLGVTSLLLALGFPFLCLIIFVVMLIVSGQIENGAFVGFVTILAASIAAVVVHLTGVILGIAGAYKKDSKKLFPVLGIVFNGVPLLLSAIVCILFVAFLIHPFPLGPK